MQDVNAADGVLGQDVNAAPLWGPGLTASSVRG